MPEKSSLLKYSKLVNSQGLLEDEPLSKADIK